LGQLAGKSAGAFDQAPSISNRSDLDPQSVDDCTILSKRACGFKRRDDGLRTPDIWRAANCAHIDDIRRALTHWEDFGCSHLNSKSREDP
jgi:hypothetical protein